MLQKNISIYTFVHQVIKDIECTLLGAGSRPNLTPAEKQALRNQKLNPNIIIKSLDKGEGDVVVQDRTQYEVLCYKLLNNTAWYRKISPLSIQYFNQLVNEAKATGVITFDTWKFVRKVNPRVPTFYALPKTHKNLLDPTGRPIVLGISSLTEIASVRFWLQSTLRRCTTPSPTL